MRETMFRSCQIRFRFLTKSCNGTGGVSAYIRCPLSPSHHLSTLSHGAEAVDSSRPNNHVKHKFLTLHGDRMILRGFQLTRKYSNVFCQYDKLIGSYNPFGDVTVRNISLACPCYRKRGLAPHLRPKAKKKKRKNVATGEAEDEEWEEQDEDADIEESEGGEEEEEREETEENDAAGKKVVYSDVTVTVTSARVDNVFGHAGFSGLSRNKVEEDFYEGLVRLNGKILEKKAKQLKPGDVCDVVREVDPSDNTLLKVCRIKILNAKDTDNDRMCITLRRYKNLYVRYDST